MSTIRNYIKNKLVKDLIEGESGYYPPGAEHDPYAPYNQPNEPEISKYVINYENQQFNVEMDNGTDFNIDFIDVLEKYWKKHTGSFELHNKEFGHLDTEMDKQVIKKLRDENYDFSDELMDIIEYKNSFNDNDEPGQEYEPDDID